jgi:hypothetical protein
MYIVKTSQRVPVIFFNTYQLIVLINYVHSEKKGILNIVFKYPPVSNNPHYSPKNLSKKMAFSQKPMLWSIFS